MSISGPVKCILLCCKLSRVHLKLVVILNLLILMSVIASYTVSNSSIDLAHLKLLWWLLNYSSASSCNLVPLKLLCCFSLWSHMWVLPWWQPSPPQLWFKLNGISILLQDEWLASLECFLWQKPLSASIVSSGFFLRIFSGFSPVVVDVWRTITETDSYRVWI